MAKDLRTFVAHSVSPAQALKCNVIRPFQSVADFRAPGALPAAVFSFLETRPLGQQWPPTTAARMHQPVMINSSANKVLMKQGLLTVSRWGGGWGINGATLPFPWCSTLAGSAPVVRMCACHSVNRTTGRRRCRLQRWQQASPSFAITLWQMVTRSFLTQGRVSVRFMLELSIISMPLSQQLMSHTIPGKTWEEYWMLLEVQCF